MTEFGGPGELQVHDIAEPSAGPGEIRLRVCTAAVNPTDTHVRNGARRKSLEKHDPPYVPGMDVAGVVDAVGAGTRTELAVGDRAMGIVVPVGSHGAYAEKVVLPAESVAPAPAGTSHAEAATLPMNGLTARLSLDLLNLNPGSTLAVTGAAGAYGGYVIQLAKAAGLRVVADAASEDEQLVRDLGADVVVPRGEQVAEAIRDEVPDGADGLADGSVQGEQLLPAVRDGGVITSVRGWRGQYDRGIEVRPTLVVDYAREHAKLDELREQAERGVLSLRVARTFPPERTAEAHRALEGGGVRGRLVILPSGAEHDDHRPGA
ncbi:NADP-dependent oxidoreductase [Salinifilum aidingensis]